MPPHPPLYRDQLPGLFFFSLSDRVKRIVKRGVVTTGPLSTTPLGVHTSRDFRPPSPSLVAFTYHSFSLVFVLFFVEISVSLSFPPPLSPPVALGKRKRKTGVTARATKALVRLDACAHSLAPRVLHYVAPMSQYSGFRAGQDTTNPLTRTAVNITPLGGPTWRTSVSGVVVDKREVIRQHLRPTQFLDTSAWRKEANLASEAWTPPDHRR